MKIKKMKTVLNLTLLVIFFTKFIFGQLIWPNWPEWSTCEIKGTECVGECQGILLLI
jgi:hypothetical protein